tara:strand:+ start:208 stop:585 length:378 start_codon:yes stop_codon:yes gene_type:complete
LKGVDMKINKTYQVENSLQPKKTPRPYDIVMVYCRYCQEKLDVRVYHSKAKLEHFQLINLPERIAEHLQRRELKCNECNKTFVLEKNIYDTKSEFLLKLDCSNMNAGMESWYEDAIPKYSNETYS